MLTKKRNKRIEPQHKLKEYLASKKNSNIDFNLSTGMGKSIVSKLNNHSTTLSAERLYLIIKTYSDRFEEAMDLIYPNLELPIKRSKTFENNRTILEDILFPLPKNYMPLEEISYKTDIDIERLKEILTKPTVVVSASEMILLEKVKNIKKGSLFNAQFGHMKIKRVFKKNRK